MRLEFLTLTALVLIALVSFLGLVYEVSKKFGIEQPAFGGTLREGIVGSPRFINPLLTRTNADRDLASLIYTGLFRYDENGKIAPVLAEKHDISQDGLLYTIVIKDKLYWADGEKLTADDIVFTIQLAKNQVAQSPRRANWEGVEVEKTDEKTVKFYLKKAYAPFLENLTLGILPKHIWEKIAPSQIAMVDTNIEGVGAGPYKLSSVRKDSQGAVASMKLIANKHYALGKPYIKTLELYFYADEERAFRNLQSGFLDSLGSVSPKNAETLGKEIKKINRIDLGRIIAVFLNQNAQKKFASAAIRKALSISINKRSLIEKVLRGYGEVIDGPLPIRAEEVIYDPELAKNILEKQKPASPAGEKEIAFSLTTVKTPELEEAAVILKTMWESVGFKVDIKTYSINNLEEAIIGPRKYDAFLYGEEVAGRVPDPFAFWHSSQRLHPGYNIALYANSKVDKLLENVRSEQKEEEREKLYLNIQREIKKDFPAVFLFSPSYIYITTKELGGLDIKKIGAASERFANIHKWYLNKSYVWKFMKN